MAGKRDSLTRREVLVGAGAVTASLGAVSLSSCQAERSGSWDQEADIVVVGSGVGAATAAVIAHENGDSVLVIEKASTLGGTSIKSAGVLWIPDNFTLREKGIEDGRDDCLRSRSMRALRAMVKTHVLGAPLSGLYCPAFCHTFVITS